MCDILGFEPLNFDLFKDALRHSSVIYTKRVELNSNERLEFLGDAVLELVVSEILYNKFPDKNEGELTKLRIKLVNRHFLNEKAIQIELTSVLQQYVGKNKDLKKEKHSIYGNALEALIGAIYLDRGYDYAVKFVEDKIFEEEEHLNKILQTQIDFKSRLMSWSQQKTLKIDFVEIPSPEPDSFNVRVKIADKLYGTGLGKRKKNAHQEASQATIDMLKKEGLWTEN